MLLVDRSGTMFEGGAAWYPVRDAALPAIQAWETRENIGLLAMTGENSSCPILSEVAPALGNHAAIAQEYGSLARPTKGESPFMLALDRAGELLRDARGDRFVIFVIDGQPDYCDDGNDLCSIDSVISHLQKLKASGITTLVAGLPIYAGADTARYAAALESYANAGAGEPVAAVGVGSVDIYNQCNGGSVLPPSWKAEHAASGKPPLQPLATYAAMPGNETYTALEPTDPAGLSDDFQALFARTQSCSFEAGGGKVAPEAVDRGAVVLDGKPIPHDAQNGWQLLGGDVIQLSGEACRALRADAAATLSIEFPCDAVTN
jgi:hypothetical protein